MLQPFSVSCSPAYMGAEKSVESFWL